MQRGLDHDTVDSSNGVFVRVPGTLHTTCLIMDKENNNNSKRPRSGLPQNLVKKSAPQKLLEENNSRLKKRMSDMKHNENEKLNFFSMIFYPNDKLDFRKASELTCTKFEKNNPNQKIGLEIMNRFFMKNEITKWVSCSRRHAENAFFLNFIYNFVGVSCFVCPAAPCEIKNTLFDDTFLKCVCYMSPFCSRTLTVRGLYRDKESGSNQDVLCNIEISLDHISVSSQFENIIMTDETYKDLLVIVAGIHKKISVLWNNSIGNDETNSMYLKIDYESRDFYKIENVDSYT